MKVIKTKEYPTRYEAFKNHGVIFENSEPKNQAGFEYLYYFRGESPGDYVGVSVCSFQGIKYLVDAHACYKSKQKGFSKCFETYKETKKVAIRKIKQLENWIKKQD